MFRGPGFLWFRSFVCFLFVLCTYFEYCVWRLCCVSHCSVPKASLVALPSKPFRKKFYKIHLSKSVWPFFFLTVCPWQQHQGTWVTSPTVGCNLWKQRTTISEASEFYQGGKRFDKLTGKTFSKITTLSSSGAGFLSIAKMGFTSKSLTRRIFCFV